MVTQFFDVEDVSAHDEFQAWRTDHLDEAVLTMETRSRANLHGVRCQHFGGSPFFLLEGGGHSLTIKRKICGAEEELLAWASENEIVVNFCHHCVRDKLIRDRGHRAANRTSSKMVEEFNPAIDRYDHRSAARLFDSLWPDPAVSRAVAMNLAASIRAAHMAADGSWEVTMFSDFIRLNVGQVETLTLSKGTIRLFFRAPLELNSNHRFEIQLTDSPVFPSVPIPSGICSVEVADMASLPTSVRDAHDAYIRAAASFKRGSPFKKAYSPAVLEYVESALGTTLPRPSYVTADSPGQRVTPLADELDLSQPIMEGARYRITVNAYERDPRARQLCIARHGTACVVCGFSFGSVYGPVADGFIHVHHLRPLSENGGEHEINPVEDLRPVCPNCHAVLHRRVPAFSIEEVRTMLTQQRRA